MVSTEKVLSVLSEPSLLTGEVESSGQGVSKTFIATAISFPLGVFFALTHETGRRWRAFILRLFFLMKSDFPSSALL